MKNLLRILTSGERLFSEKERKLLKKGMPKYSDIVTWSEQGLNEISRGNKEYYDFHKNESWEVMAIDLQNRIIKISLHTTLKEGEFKIIDRPLDRHYPIILGNT